MEARAQMIDSRASGTIPMERQRSAAREVKRNPAEAPSEDIREAI